MRASCPSGFICFENISLILLIVGLIVFAYYSLNNHNSPSKVEVRNNIYPESNGFFGGGLSWPYTNIGLGTFFNPLAPPLRDERYITSFPLGGGVAPVVPINVPTNIGAVETNYRQLGIITPLNQSSKDSILPLMGRPLFTNRDKWNYYTISNQHNNVKLPVSKAGRSCTNEYGCDKLYDGDTVYVEGANEAYKVTVYENDVIRYLPFI
jgi:hypothetical protein